MSRPTMFSLGRRGGRPPRFGVRATKRIEFVVTEAQRADLQSVARDEQTSLTEVIREAVNCFVADYRERRVFSPPSE